jgi:hypothetical protein
VKRRPLQSPVEPPARIRYFDPADWPAESGDPLDQWREARRTYVQQNGYPGDPLDWLRETARQIRRSLGSSSEL